MKLWLLLSAWAVAGDLRFDEGRIAARSGDSVEIIEMDKCAARKSGHLGVILPPSCDFVRGLYRYDGAVEEFSAVRRAGGYAFIEAAPLPLR